MARPKKSLLTPEIVVAAAIAMIGEGGLESFSMPKLASQLGVQAPSLYHYFASKDALFAAVARTVLTPEAPTLSPDTHWTDYLVAISVALRRTIIAHPHCAPLVVRYMPRENMFDEYEQMCQFLAASGVPARLHVRIVDGMTALTIGAAVLNENAADYTVHGSGPKPEPGTHHALETALAAIGDATSDQLFETLLRNYLDGIVAAIPEKAPALRKGKGG
ncbi:TetR family transcriptional regulator [Mycolicibacterium sp. P9-64]|uniref:TetR family transcriptional regulator n=1 Tax=Mycolicibacterium sp. P9-64 TaxID=2024612 RepID=UPI0011EDBB9A|nr:TetR family transcriptional regulator [Mycolicibacterium sp. P9-64]KAA0080547.1 TetR family transcriptional regulator [Mycolicibacterium sp. P9-64]